MKDTLTLWYANSAGGWSQYGAVHSSRRVRPGHVAHLGGTTWHQLPKDRYWTVTHHLRWFVGGTLVGWRDYALNQADILMGNEWGTTGGDQPGWCYISTFL